MAVDGTSLKTSIGGVLLVACFRNGNNEIQIVGLGIVAVENGDNWTWFLANLLPHLRPSPAFLISDGDKGLVNATKATAPDIPRFYCFRHLMENFNKIFNSMQLRALAWAMARARTVLEYNRAAADLSAMNESATKWLQEIGKEKWATAYSPCTRFNTLTSNNVESVNGALKGIRSLPILDCLMEIERYVARKWMENTKKADIWGELTRYASRRVDKVLEETTSGSIKANSSTTYVVEIKHGVGSIPLKFALQLCDGVLTCLCGYFEDAGTPCVHALIALKHAGRLKEMTRFYFGSWKTPVSREAYVERARTTNLPLVLKDALTRGECKSPEFQKKRGRPKKKRIPSQQATESLRKQIRRCGICKQVGHNRKSCSSQSF
ncbi:hypothetical protein P3T76_005804 [Phytophthora citrophthora]|uniref:SWIM-type domain-containing protein n=1 Tax=Phytophthora citrophthora TaxID=4793 RepID=A0AAD9GR13_9STRA|nr:hypothetical protein P3T76_005804 [Phytophthora citrophthora]